MNSIPFAKASPQSAPPAKSPLFCRGSSALLPILVFVAICAAPMAWAQAPSPANAAALAINLGTEPQTVDPAKASGVPEAEILLNLQEGLVVTDHDCRILPGLADSWKISPDGLTYTFHLRAAKWSNGDPVTADDFVWQWIRVLQPDTASEYAILLYYIAGARAFNEGKTTDTTTVGLKAPNKRTLEVRLNEPTPYFLNMLAHTVFVPFHRKSIEDGPREWVVDPKSYLCCGPFQLKEWRSHDKMVFEKNPNYWDAGVVKMGEVKWLMIETESSALAAFNSGQLDVMGRPPLSAMDQLQKEGKVSTETQIGTYFINFNCRKKPFSDVRVRRALALAIDRHIVIRYISRAGEQPAMALVPYGIKDADGKKDFRDVGGDYFKNADYDEARRLLAEAGYPKGKGFPRVEFIYNTRDQHRAIAAELQQRWNKNLGVYIELRNMEWKVYSKLKQDGDYQIGRGGWIGDFSDPMTFLETFKTESGNNNSKWSNKEYDDIIEASKKQADPVKRMTMLHEAEGIMMKDMPIAPIYFYADPYMQKPWIKGIVRTPLGYLYLKKAWVENKK